jgi:uncharacterized protein YbjT (DUF2867 family)
MKEKSVLNVVLLGATGAVGGEVLKALVAMSQISTITVLARRTSDTPVHAKVRWTVVDVMDAAAYQHLLSGHQAAICTLGVGQPTKVSREEFTRVDHDAVLAFATACRASGVAHFELLGSVAASAASASFYLKSKGALRDAIAALGFTRFSAFQPSMLLTAANRYGFAQGVMLAVWPLLSRVLAGPLKKYRGVKVEDLGQAMARNLMTRGTGTEILHWPEFTRI